ncbi:hypothetical protein BDC45DRAFT_227018 [Circinella umbellata]|nr:hypothetical protein BDC45DRAFT_227018 [Circinella umbellata]
MDNKNIDVDQHFYCPYQECSYQHTTKDRQADLIRHIQLNHYGDLAYQNDVHHQCYRTVDGDVLVDFSEIYHSTLPSGTILIPCDANGHVHKQYADMINNSEQTIPISITKKTNVKSSKKRRVPVVEQQPQQDGSSSGGSPLQDTPATRRSKRQKRSVWKEDEWVLY